jgi:predicted transcriptional regulator
VESIVEQNPHVETIQVVLEAELLRRVNRAARRLKLNRSALIREALRQHLKQLQMRSREEADRRGYERKPEDEDALSAWDGAAAWPDD